MTETAELRKRIRQLIDEARHVAATHRADAARGEAAFEPFAATIATPVFRARAGVLKAEGYPFRVATPAGVVRLEPERGGEGDGIELRLETSRYPVAVIGRVQFTHGRHVEEDEQVLSELSDLGVITEEQVIGFVLRALPPFLRR
jgi:hypothetical protein